MSSWHADPGTSARAVPPIPEAVVERGPSGETDAPLEKPFLDEHESIDASLGRDSDELQDACPNTARQRFVTTILINLSAIMERTDEQLLPAVYRFVGASFQVHSYLTNKRN